MSPPRLLLALAVASSLVGHARADESSEARKAADRLVLEGKTLGDAGRVMEAIERFKAAEAKYPRAIHGCNIGLAYAQLKSFPQALLFLENCRQRATGPLPTWVEARYQRTLETLRAGGYSLLEIISEPAGAEVQVVGFARDETFLTPRTVWLTAGEAELQVSREGYTPERKTIQLTGASHRLVVRLQRVPTPVVEPVVRVVEKPVETRPSPVVAAPPPTEPPRGRPLLKLIGGVTFGVGALVALVAWVPQYVALDKESATAKTNDEIATFKQHKTHLHTVTYPAVFVTGGLVVLTGVGLLVAGSLLPASKSAAVSVSASPMRGGGFVSVEGRF